MYTIDLNYQEIVRENYSYLKASIGFNLAALYAGYIPKPSPTAVANPNDIISDCRVITPTIILLIANIVR
jgi:hypothetical protein